MSFAAYIHPKNAYSAAIAITPSLLGFAMLKLLLTHLNATQYANYTLFLVGISFANGFVAGPYVNFLKVGVYAPQHTDTSSFWAVFGLIGLLILVCNLFLYACFGAFGGNFFFTVYVCLYQLCFAIYNFAIFILNKNDRLPRLLALSVAPPLLNLASVGAYLGWGGKNHLVVGGLSVVGYVLACVALRNKIHRFSFRELGRIFRQSWRYVAPLGVYNLLVWVNASVGVLVLNYYYTPADLSVFGAFQVILTKLYALIGSLALVRFTADLFRLNDISEALSVNLKLYVVVAAVALVVLTSLPSFWIALLVAEPLANQWKLFVLMNLIYFLSSLVSLLEQVFYYRKQTHTLVINFMIGNAITLCSIALLPFSGVLGVAIAYLLGFAGMIVYLRHEWQKSNRSNRIYQP